MTGMNANRDPESVMAAWLDEGPTDLPDATRRAILTAIQTTSQARRGLLAPGTFTRMNIFARGVAVLAVAVVAIGALALINSPSGFNGTQPSPSVGPSATTAEPTLPPLDATFISPANGFRVGYPAGWTVTPGTGGWPPGTARYPGNPVSDAIVAPSGSDRVRLSGASIALPSGTTIDQFRTFASPLSSPFNPSACTPVAPLPTPVTIAYQAGPTASPQPVAAVASVNGCDALAELGGYIYDVETIAGGRGYTFTIDGHITTTDALAWLATITLEPESAPPPSPSPSPSASR